MSFSGDALLRFCPEKYYPFDPSQKDKYVVHDDYRPTWKVPTLAKLYSDLGKAKGRFCLYCCDV